ESSEGKINSLQFAKKVTLSGKANLSGHKATFFLDQMVKEFGRNRDVSQKGTIYYEFDLDAITYDLESPVPEPSPIPPSPRPEPNPMPNPSPVQSKPKSEPKSPSPPPKVFNALDAQLLESLEDYLCVAEWKKADEITAKLMLKVANQTMSLNPDDIADFPCEALRKIDELWQIYSHNRFGFLAQAEVFNDCFLSTSYNIILTPKNWQKYAQALGWYANAQWPNRHGDLRFSLTNVPKGYLPFLPMWQGAWWGSFLDGQGERFHLLIKRVKQCQLSTISVPNIHEPPEPDLGPSGDLEEEIENFGKELKDFFQRGIGQ
ncbi:MAG: GUN4 domain-containing protein, partial [Microcystaceae cyanobacterium]